MNFPDLGKERIFGIVGHPLTHSFSEKFFKEKFTKENVLDADFIVFSINEISLIKNILSQYQSRLKGFCITIPHKKNIIPFLEGKSEAVTATGACNCVQIIGGKLFGHNTDVFGFEESLLPMLKPSHKKAMVFGNGGAAAAVNFILDKLGIERITVSRQSGLKQLTYSSLKEHHFFEFTILINCTPLGTFPEVETCPDIPYHFLNSNHLLYDLVYNPPETKFLRLGKEAGCTTKNGFDMLLIQAEENWKLWKDL